MHSVLAEVLRRRARPVTVACVSSVGHQICEALVPLAIGLAVDHAVDGGPPLAILVAVGVILVLFVVLATGGGTTFWTLTAAAATEAHDLRVRAARTLLADERAGTCRRAGELANVLVSDAKATAEVMRAIVNVVSGCAGMLVTVVVLVSIEPWLGLGIAIGVPALTLAIDRVSPWLEHRITARQQTSGLAAALAAELVHALRRLRGFGGVPEAARRYRRASRQSLTAALRGTTASAAVEGAGLVETGLALVGTAAAAGALTTSGVIGVGEFLTVVATASFVGEPVQRITAGIKQAAISRASAARIAPLLDFQEPNHTPFTPLGPLRLRATGADITVRPGEMLGIATTDPATADGLINLFTGNPGRSGRALSDFSVLLGDVALTALDRRTLSRHVLTEPHAVHLFGRTLHEALDTGRSGPTAAAITAAHADEVSSLLIDGGLNLSGGQRQRVALARALAARPPVLVLHDPLTAVDSATEAAVAEGLAALRRAEAGTTVVVSTSPGLLARCDRVVFLAQTQPPTVATHALLTQDAEYAKAVLR
ncbi:ABC transporter ATP-binding protein [Actinocrispum sp. NPDC049592]|uniref:ABC transporter ATP-binding protein n=1 Tax=Actinocrispum sp. NPDC049592 TaxID=3154835 RepID=UPI00343CE696